MNSYSILPQFGIRIVHKKLVVSQIFCTFIGDLQQVTNIFDMTTDYKDTVLISKKKELRKINCRHFVFLYVFSLMGASRPLAPRCFQV